MRKLSLFFIVFIVTGCAGTIIEQRQQVSSAHIGCPPPDIYIDNQSAYSWTAECRGKKYFCTVAPNAACKEEISGR